MSCMYRTYVRIGRKSSLVGHCGKPVLSGIVPSAHTALVNVLARRRASPVATPRARHEEELSLQRRARRWLGTTAVTWPIWALTGAPTGLPHGSGNHHHIVISLGIWPAYLMIG